MYSPFDNVCHFSQHDFNVLLCENVLCSTWGALKNEIMYRSWHCNVQFPSIVPDAEKMFKNDSLF